MAISAQRFKFLDKETNIPTIDFKLVSNNQVYNNVEDLAESALESLDSGKDMLNKLQSSVASVLEAVRNASSQVLSSLSSVINSVIDSISNLPLPDIVKDAFNMVKQLDLQGVKDFFGSLLKVGGAFLCNGLDFLKLFMLGFAINKNIISGLITALLLSWMDRICRGQSAQEFNSLSNTKKLESTIPPKGVQVDSSNIFDTFTNDVSDFMKKNVQITLPPVLTTTDFVSNVVSGNISGSIDNLKQSEVLVSNRSSYISAITTELNNHLPSTPEYKNLLEAKGKLSITPPISSIRRELNNNLSNVNDRLGSVTKNMLEIDLSAVRTMSMNSTEKSIFSKIEQFQNTAKTNPDLLTRSNVTGGYSDFDFNSILPVFNETELAYLNSKEGSGLAHRVLDMHPTSTLLLG